MNSVDFGAEFTVLSHHDFCFVLKEKITKEMNYILSNQDTVLSQITQLESSITQTEVCGSFFVILQFIKNYY